MARQTLQEIREDGHWPHFTRHQRGKTPTRPTRPVYGYRVKCECGWERRVNGDKRLATATHNDHLRKAANG